MAEADRVPTRHELAGTTALGLRRWRSGHELPPQHLGPAHPHASWIALAPEPVE